MGHIELRRVLYGITLLALVQSVPPDKIRPLHIIKTRGIDLNNAHSLSFESRLKKTVEPTGYKLELEPYLEDGMFKGHVSINLTWLEDDYELALHADQTFEITETELWIQQPSESTFTKMSIQSTDWEPRKPIYKLYLAKPVTAQSTGKLEIDYKGKLVTANSEAFFKTSYIDESEQESIVAGTQLRPNNARRVFPCFDEPGFKVPFEFSLVRPRNMVALSNMPVSRTEDIAGEPDAVLDHFEKTPPMSTFAFGFVIADLKQIENITRYEDKNGNSIELRVWGRQEFLPALEGLPAKLNLVFKKIAEYWQVPLPLRKIDIVALPNYQGVKPADNWGLIVFKESDLSSRGCLQLAQELSYQWLGALTTPSWWVHAHLNKALVGYVAAETALKISNGSEMDGKWPMTMLYSLYYEFSKRFPHSRITGMKQETACTKIELLFRMLNYTLGEETFKKGVRAFIKARKFKTFTDKDLWNALNEAAVTDGRIQKDLNLETVIQSWLDKDRLPFVTAERLYDRNSVQLSQTVFLRERPHDVPNADIMLWTIPIVTVNSGNLNFSNSTPTTWMSTRQATEVNMPGSDQFIIVNPEEIAPFLVNYDQHNWNLLSTFLQSKGRCKIPELTRAKLLHDAWNLAYAGQLSFATALNMTVFMKNERHHLVWDPVFTMIDHIGRHIDNSDVHSKFQAYIRSLLIPLYNDLLKDEDRQTKAGSRKTLRSLTKTFLCKAGFKPCIREAQEQYRKWMDATDPDEGNPIANQYICPVFKWGTRKEWEFGLQRVMKFPSSRKQSERTFLLKTLAGCPVDEEKILRLLNLTVLMNNGAFSEADIFLVFSMLTGSSNGYTTLFQFLVNNWAVLKERFSSKTNLWDNLITAATSQFTTAEGLERVRAFAKEHSGEFGSADHIVDKSLKVIKEEAQWSTENIPVIREWLNNMVIEDDQFIGKSI